MASEITVSHVTKDYGQERGNFGIDFSIAPGEAFGLVGENGAGKTTLIRQMMGFVRPDRGKITIDGLDSYRQAYLTKNLIGYVPGEINFPDIKTGSEFLKTYGKMKGATNTRLADSLIKRLQLDIRAYPKRMSKGMKQKTAIVLALVANPKILIMDEPTTGLDPLMRDEFLKIMAEEKQEGKTIVMSSNTYEELEAVCDRVALISKGRLLDIADLKAIRKRNERDFKIEFKAEGDYRSFKASSPFAIIRDQPVYCQVTVRVPKDRIGTFVEDLQTKNLKFMSEQPYDLETYFKERRKDSL